MADLSAANRGTGSNVVGATSIGVVPTSNFTGGKTTMAVLCISYDNTGSAGADPFSSITDSKGNLWTSRLAILNDPGAADAGCAVRVFTSKMLAGTLLTTDTITISFGSFSVTAKAWTLMEILSAAGSVIFVTGAGTTSATATPTITSGSITLNDMIIGVCGREGNDGLTTPDADVTNGTWDTAQTAGVGTTTSGQQIATQRKLATGTATQTYNLTWAVSRDNCIGWIQVRTGQNLILAVDQASYSYTAQTVVPLWNHKVGVTQGSYSYAAQTVVPLYNRKLAVVQASYSYLAQTVGLAKGYTLTVSGASYSYNAQTISPLYNRKLAVSQGSYSYSGQNVGTYHNYALNVSKADYNYLLQFVYPYWNRVCPVAQGSYSYSAQNIVMLWDRIFSIAGSTYNYQPQNINALWNRKLNVSQAQYDYNAQTLQLLWNRVLSVAVGLYDYNGQDVRTLWDRVLGINTTNYAYTSFDVDLQWNQLSGEYELVVNGASYGYNGQNVQLLHNRVIPISPAVYSYLAQDVEALYNRFVQVANAVYDYTGQDVQGLWNRALPVDFAPYDYLGQDVDLVYSAELFYAPYRVTVRLGTRPTHEIGLERDQHFLVEERITHGIGQ